MLAEPLSRDAAPPPSAGTQLLADTLSLLRQHLQAKKVTKHLQKAAATGHGYTNAENPFGDANVTQRFVWGKKIEKQLHEGADVRELTAKAERERQVERLVSGADCLFHAAASLRCPVTSRPQQHMQVRRVCMRACLHDRPPF